MIMDINRRFPLNVFKKADNLRSRKQACRAFTSLKDWQVMQYRAAVNENQWFMGEKLGREVSWAEAEQDFLKNGYYGCAEKWRTEYCTALCDHCTDCSLAQRFNEAS